MKKLLFLIGILSSGLYGASIDHIQTYSPDYLSDQAQTGMIDEVSAYYNPAGLSRLDKGKYIHLGLQFANGHEKMSYKGKEHKAILNQLIPNVSLTSVDDNGAYFFTFGGLAGGGKLEYDGVSGIDVLSDLDQFKPLGVYDKGSTLTGKNLYEQATLGRAFTINDQLSVSVAGRIVHGSRNLSGTLNIGTNPSTAYKQAKVQQITQEVSKAVDAATQGSGLSAAQIAAIKQQKTTQALTLLQTKMNALQQNGLSGDLDSKREAWGYGFQLGVNYKVNDKLNLAARYDSRIKMNFKAKGSENQLQTADIIGSNIGLSTFYPQYAINSKIRRDLPAILSVGASYKVTDNYLVSTSANYYFNRHAKMDRVTTFGGHEHGRDYKNGWEIALGNEYKLNDKFTVIGSVNYARTGAKNSSFNDTEYALNSVTLGAGLRYKYDETLSITGSVAHFIYDKEDGNFKEKYKVNDNQKYHKEITAFGLSVTKKF
ncbi:MAG: outer membrane protein transport protein [Fusobacterium periodonticum]|nr:outer membrane protein transport protein [Fusobacterium periodonticum]